MSNFIGSWRCIESGFEDGPLNMAIDETLLNLSHRNEIDYATLRFFGFRPNCATFGVSQPFNGSQLLHNLKATGYEITRRPTGGGIVIHDMDLCYSVVAKTDLNSSFQTVQGSYEAIHQAVYAGFRHEGIELAFAQEGEQRELTDASCAEEIVKCDLLYEGKKLAGAAERRKGNYFLHQGFISLKPFVHTRMEYFAFFEKMRRAVAEGFKDRFGANLSVGGLFLNETTEAVKTKEEKYALESWNAEKKSGLVKGRPAPPSAGGSPPARGLKPRAGTAPETPSMPGASSAVSS